MMKSLRIFLLQPLCTEVHTHGRIPGKVSREQGRLQNIICHAVHHAAIRDTVTLCKDSNGLSKVSLQRELDNSFFPLPSGLVSLHVKGPFCNILSDTSGSRLLFWPWRARNIRLFDEYGGAAKLIKTIKKDFSFFFLRVLQVSFAPISPHMVLHSSLQFQQS